MSGGYPFPGDLANANDQGSTTASSVGTAVANSATASTYGSYVQLVASTPSDTCFMMVSLEGGPYNFSNNLIVKIAVGAAASEVDIITDLMHFNGSASAQSGGYLFPLNIPAGTRISAASAGNVNGADSISVQVTLFDGSFTQQDGCAGVDSIGITSAHGTALVPGAANTKGSYAQLTAATSRDYVGFTLAIDAVGAALHGTTATLIDVAIGAAASEVVILPNYMYRHSVGNTQTGNGIMGPFMIGIPSGTRIAARQQNVAGATNIGLALYGIYQ